MSLVPSRRRTAVVAAPASAALLSAAGRYIYNSLRNPPSNMGYAPPRRRSVKRRRTERKSFTVPRGVPYRKLRRKRTYKCKIKKLCKFMKQQQAIHIHRSRNVKRLTSVVKGANLDCNSTGGTMSLHQAAMANLRFYDPNTNTLVTNDPTIGTYSRDMAISIFRSCMLKNNYVVPCMVEVYSCVPKADTSNDPVAFYNSGLADQGNPSNISPLVRFKDSIDLKNMWTCKLVKKKLLMAGQSLYCKNFAKQFDFNISTFDGHNLEYQRLQGGHCWVVRVSGTVGHDSTLVEVGVMQAAVDIIYDAEYRIQYDAGKDLHDISVADSSDQFTNAGQGSNKPMVVNQQWTV